MPPLAFAATPRFHVERAVVHPAQYALQLRPSRPPPTPHRTRSLESATPQPLAHRTLQLHRSHPDLQLVPHTVRRLRRITTMKNGRRPSELFICLNLSIRLTSTDPVLVQLVIRHQPRHLCGTSYLPRTRCIPPAATGWVRLLLRSMSVAVRSYRPEGTWRQNTPSP
jgi:hypothetical protein